MYRAIRRFVVFPTLIALAAVATTRVEAQNPNGKAAPARKAQAGGGAGERLAAAPDPARMRAILADWERLSSQLKSVEVGIKRLDSGNAAWGDESFVGRAMLQTPNLAWLNFQKEVVNPKTGKTVLQDHERIICTGTEVWQYVVPTEEIFIFPLNKQNQKHALEEGPLPFLFNLKAAEAEGRYTMTLHNEAPDYFVIAVLPKEKVDKAAFSHAFIKLNKKTYFPDRILLVMPDGKSKKDFTLVDVKPNEKINPANFKGAVLPKPWKVIRDVPPNQNAANPPAQVGQGKAQRPAPGGGAVRPR